MFKNKLRKLFLFLKIISDIVIIYFSFTLGYVLKFKLAVLGLSTKVYPQAQYENYLAVMGYIIVLWLLAFVASGMYKYYTGPLARMNESMSVIRGVLLGTFEIMAFTFLFKTFPDSRFVVFYAAIIAIVSLIISRSIVASLLAWLHTFGLGNMRAAIIGHDTSAQRIAERIIAYPEYGHNYVGFICSKYPQHLIHPLKHKFIRLGNFKQIKQLIKKYQISALFLADQDLNQEEIYKLANYCNQNNILFRFTTSEYQRNIIHDSLDSINMLGIKQIRFSWSNRILKRMLDLFFVIPLIILMIPLMAVICLLISITSSGPIIYKQTRVTRFGREFNFYKFRSMPVDSEKGKPILSTKDQKHRTTSIGYWLRKSSLDELPQLFNVLLGDMSIIGPRPERPFFHNKYSKEIPNWNERLMVRGGITGWAQINGRAELSASPLEKLEYDLYYIENWSLLFDLKIVLRTFLYVILQKDAY